MIAINASYKLQIFDLHFVICKKHKKQTIAVQYSRKTIPSKKYIASTTGYTSPMLQG